MDIREINVRLQPRWRRTLAIATLPGIFLIGACAGQQPSQTKSAATAAPAVSSPVTSPTSGQPSVASPAPAAKASPVAKAASPTTGASPAAKMASPVARAASPSPSPSAALAVDAPAVTLRTNLNTLLQEHVYLAGAATGAALGGRDAEFKAAADTLDQNTIELGKAIGSVYGPQAEEAFVPLWRAHIGFFVDYTQGAAAGDQAKKDKALADLDGYRADFDAFLSGANPNLPKGAVADLLKAHVATLVSAIDAQAANDPVKAYNDLTEAANHMQMIADPLAGAIAKQFPDKFPGRVDSKGADLRVLLNNGLQEHEYLAAAATNAAIGGREAEFKAAADALDGNTQDLGKAIGSVYGPQAEEAFVPLWRKHIGFFVDYTQGAAAGDQAKKNKAAADLDGYRADFDAFLSGANPNLPKGAVAELLTPHVTLTLAAIDAQAAKDPVKAFSSLKQAADHMHMIADPLTGAIVKQFPDKFQ